MKNEIIYFNGCSYTYGIGINADESALPAIRFSWTVSNRLGLRDHNSAKPGSCNMRIFRDSLLEIPSINPKCAVIVWSDPLRTEFDTADSKEFRQAVKYKWGLMQVRPASVNLLDRRVKRAMDEYYTVLETESRSLLYTMTYMIVIKNMSESLGIPIIQLPFRHHGWAGLNNVIENTTNDDLKNQLITCRDILINEPNIYGIRNPNDNFIGLSCGEEYLRWLDTVGIRKSEFANHPDKFCHDSFSDWLVEIIREKGIC